jgi:dipeptidyl aminopeptidase/acylaminoacyl peptidase
MQKMTDDVIGSRGALLMVLLMAGRPLSGQELRPVTVKDAITTVNIMSADALMDRPAVFSPGGGRFAVVVERGDLGRNRRVFALVLFRTAQALTRPVADTIVTMPTSTNYAGITDVRWLSDSVLTFLGAPGRQLAQVYAVNCRTRRVRRLTQHTARVTGYAVAPDLSTVVYSTAASAPSIGVYDSLLDHGLVVGDQLITDLMAERVVSTDPIGPYYFRVAEGEGLGDQTFIQSRRTGRTTPVLLRGGLGVGFGRFYRTKQPFSPDGRYILLHAKLARRWRGYTSSFLGTQSTPSTLVVVDVRTGMAVPLLNTPAGLLPSAAWSPDGTSVIGANVYMPLDVTDSTELARRRAGPGVARIVLATGSVTRLSGGILDSLRSDYAGEAVEVERWDRRSGDVVISAATVSDTAASSQWHNLSTLLVFRAAGADWHDTGTRADADSARRVDPTGRVAIRIRQGLNQWPRLEGSELRSGRNGVIADFNPQFRTLAFGHVSLFRWQASDGSSWDGDLYVPPKMSPTSRYPLVIQTHGCTTTDFWIDGPSATGFAAQPLAGKGIVVLQMGRCAERLDSDTAYQRWAFTPGEARMVLKAYEAAIDSLSRQGLVDRDRVGLIGWSHTGWHVEYALTHPDPGYRFAAGTIADGEDWGYLTYVAYPALRQFYDAWHGGSPWGSNAGTFWQGSLPMHADKVSAPLRIEATSGFGSVLAHWESFQALKHFGKPVELVVLPEGQHMLVRPSDRLTSQQGNVDWFCFWLKGEEDPAPEKRDQYARWRHLREQLAVAPPRLLPRRPTGVALP